MEVIRRAPVKHSKGPLAVIKEYEKRPIEGKWLFKAKDGTVNVNARPLFSESYLSYVSPQNSERSESSNSPATSPSSNSITISSAEVSPDILAAVPLS